MKLHPTLDAMLRPATSRRSKTREISRPTGFARAQVLAALAALLSLAPLPTRAQVDGQPQVLPTVTLQAGMRNIVAMVARTPQQRQTGLMFRKEMASHEGMLFVFEEASMQCFWMRNTPLPLSTAFVADDGTIVNIEDMQPYSDQSHCSTKPVRFVLEMNKGWFQRSGLKAGSRIGGQVFAKAGG